MSLNAGWSGEESSLTPAGAAPASSAAATTAGHHKLPSLQFPSPIGGENGSDLATNVWQHLDAGRFESHLEFSRNRPAYQDVHAHFNEAPDDLVRLLFKEHDFPALQIGFALQANQKQARRHVEDWRHTALAVGNRNQHPFRNASFMPAPTWLADKSGSPLESRLTAMAGPARGQALSCKMQRGARAGYRNLRRRWAAGRAIGKVALDCGGKRSAKPL